MKKIIFALLTTLLLAACTSTTHTEEIIVGGLLPLSGAGSYIGEGNLAGMELAVTHANRIGIQTKLVIEDSQTSPAQAVSGIHTLAQKGAAVTYSTFSGVSFAAQPVAQEYDMLLLAESGHPTITDFSNVARTFYTTSSANQALLNHAQKTNVTSIAFFYVQDEFGTSGKDVLVATAKSAGITIIDTVPYSNDAYDVRTDITRIEQQEPDAYYVLGMGAPVAHIFNQLEERGSEGTRFGFMLCGQGNILEIASDALEGHYGIDALYPTDTEEYNLFLQEYNAQYSRPLDQEVLVAYASTALAIDAMKQGASTPEEITAYLSSQTWDTLLGPLTFDKTGDSSLPMQTKRISQGTCE